MTAALTYSVLVDWDRSGTYETDITGDIEMPGSGITIDRGFGKDGIYRISKVTIVVANRAGTYSFGNSASARFGQLRPGVPIKMQVNHNSVDYTLWTGYIQQFKVTGVSAGSVSLCTFECTDIADYLAQYTPVNVLVDDRTTDAAYTAIAAAMGMSSGDYNFLTTGQALPTHWVRNKDGLSAMADVLQSEMGGSWYVDALGVIQGETRATRLGISVDQTWGDGTNIVPKTASVEVTDVDLISEASVQANVFVDDTPDLVIFTFSRNATNPTPDSILVAAGTTYGPVSLDFAGPIESLSTPTATTDWTGNSAIDGTGTDLTSDMAVTVTLQGAGFELTISNTGASDLYVTKFQLRGLAQNYVTDRPIFKYSLPIPGDKSPRGIQVQLPFADDSNTARNYSVQLARTWRYEYPRLALTFDGGKHDDIAVATLGVELGQQIKYTDTALTTKGTYSDDWWYIESIRHQFSPQMGRFNYYTSVEMVPTYLFRNLDAILFDDFNRDDATGDLGNSTEGTAWANDTGFDIATNVAVANTDTLSMATQNLGTGITDQVIEVTLGDIGTGDEVGVVFRYADADNQYRVYLDKGSDEVILEKNVATSVSEIASPAFTVGTDHELRVIIQSTRIRVWVDRYLYIDETDSGLSAGTNVGLFARNADATTTFEDFYSQGLDA